MFKFIIRNLKKKNVDSQIKNAYNKKEEEEKKEKEITL